MDKKKIVKLIAEIKAGKIEYRDAWDQANKALSDMKADVEETNALIGDLTQLKAGLQTFGEEYLRRMRHD